MLAVVGGVLGVFFIMSATSSIFRWGPSSHTDSPVGRTVKVHEVVQDKVRGGLGEAKGAVTNDGVIHLKSFIFSRKGNKPAEFRADMSKVGSSWVVRLQLQCKKNDAYKPHTTELREPYQALSSICFRSTIVLLNVNKFEVARLRMPKSSGEQINLHGPDLIFEQQVRLGPAVIDDDNALKVKSFRLSYESE